MTNKDEMPLEVVVWEDIIFPQTYRADKRMFLADTKYIRHDHPDYISKAELREKLEGMKIKPPTGNEMELGFNPDPHYQSDYNAAINKIIEEYLE